MALTSASISGLRCLQDVRLELGPRLTLVSGQNGAGKTSVLEGLFLAGRGRSFRTHQTEKLIRTGEQLLRVVVETLQPRHRIGLEYGRDVGYSGRIDGRDIKSLAELPQSCFVEVIDPEIHRLVCEGPGERRRWLDWGVFHVEHSFLHHWSRYSRALKQRNAALRSGAEPDPWESELITSGELVTQARNAWLSTLASPFAACTTRLLGEPVEMTLRPGWSHDLSLKGALDEARERDRARCLTTVGAHRADVVLKWRGNLARDVCSRGQQKLLSMALVLSVLKTLQDLEGGNLPTLLLDDPAAELDSERLGIVIDEVAALRCQLVVTALDTSQRLFGTPDRMFHVEHGRIAAV